MKQKLAVKLRRFGRVCPATGYKEESIKVGVPVVIETDRGIEYGEMMVFKRGIPHALSRDVKLKKIIRYATEEDVEKSKTLAALEETAVVLANQKIAEHELPIKIIGIEYLFDTSRVIIYYRIAEGVEGPNLRDFSRDMAKDLKARVDTRQISSRDQARLLGGIGPCGRFLCCSVWLGKPKHVTVKRVKKLGLAISPTRTSGMCGRLMCCLEYEKE